MKKLLLLVLLAVVISGCASPYPVGLISTNIKTPVGQNDKDIIIKNATEDGSASCYSFLGLFAWGDNSLKAAAENGGIKNVWYADYEVDNVLGFWGKYTVTVHGE